MKKTSVFPWETNEVYHLKRLLEEHPEWSDSTVCNQFKYQCNFTKHTSKAIRSKINTLRPNKCKSKWNAIAHTKLAQMVINKNTYEEMAAEFNTSVAAIAHQVHRIKNLGLLKATPGRQVNAHNRVTTGPLPKCIEQTKQLNLDFNQRDAVAKQNKLSAQIRNLDNSVAKLMQDNCEKLIGPEIPRTATEIGMGYNNQQRMLDNLLQVANNLTQVLNNTLQLMVGK